MTAQVGNWIRQICNTNGTGDLLLAATPTADVLAFSDVLPAGLTYYAIRDGDNRETGIGTFDGTSTIVRTTVTSTKVGAVYLENGVPLDLSGASIVECTLNSAAFIEALHATAIKEDIAIRETAATGIVSGGLVSGNTATTVSLAGGDGEIIDAYTDRRNPSRINISWVAITSYLILMPSDIGVQVIYFDNTGTIQQKSGGLTSTERRTNIQVALVYYKNGSIIAVQNAGILSNEVGNTVYDWMYYTDIALRVKGLGLNPVNAVMSIWSDAGQLISPGINVAADLTNPNIETFPAIGSATIAEPFDIVFEDGTTYLLNQTVIPEFHESAPGVATALTGNDSVIHYVYRTLGNTLILQLGQPLYTDGKTARDSLEVNLAGFTQFTGAEVVLLIAQVYVANGATDFTDSNKAGIVSLIGSGANASGGISVSDFLALSDVDETTYIGNAGNPVIPNAAEMALEFSTSLNLSGPNINASQIIDVMVASIGDQLRLSNTGTEHYKLGREAGGFFVIQSTQPGFSGLKLLDSAGDEMIVFDRDGLGGGFRPQQHCYLKNGKNLFLGDSSPFAINHDGTNGNINNSLGTLFIRGTTPNGIVNIQTEDSGGVVKNGINVGGAVPVVVLYGDGIERLRTKSTTVNLSIPTSSAGLSAGDLWNNSGVVNIV